MLALVDHGGDLFTSCSAPPPALSAPFGRPPYRVHVGQLLGNQVGVERQEVFLDLRRHFLFLCQAERAVAIEGT